MLWCSREGDVGMGVEMSAGTVFVEVGKSTKWDGSEEGCGCDAPIGLLCGRCIRNLFLSPKLQVYFSSLK